MTTEKLRTTDRSDLRKKKLKIIICISKIIKLQQQLIIKVTVFEMLNILNVGFDFTLIFKLNNELHVRNDVKC